MSAPNSHTAKLLLRLADDKELHLRRGERETLRHAAAALIGATTHPSETVATRNDVLEEAAKVCVDAVVPVKKGYRQLVQGGPEGTWADGRHACAAAIRALKNADPQVKTVAHDAVALNAHGGEGLTAQSASIEMKDAAGGVASETTGGNPLSPSAASPCVGDALGDYAVLTPKKLLRDCHDSLLHSGIKKQIRDLLGEHETTFLDAPTPKGDET